MKPSCRVLVLITQRMNAVRAKTESDLAFAVENRRPRAVERSSRQVRERPWRGGRVRGDAIDLVN